MEPGEDTPEHLSRKRKRFFFLAAAAYAGWAICYNTAALRLLPGEPRTRAPSRFATFYARMTSDEFRRHLRLPRELFDLILAKITEPSPKFPRGRLDTRCVTLFRHR
jgi:hypothetical protein